MHRVGIDAAEPTTIGATSERHRLSGPLGTTDIAINHYRLAPGEGLAGGLHTHMDQEEVFVVLAGTMTFETLDGELTAREGEAIRFAPGEYQSGRNGADRDAVVLALGAPRETTDMRVPLDCPDCGHGSLRLDTEDGLTFDCPGCASEHVPANCPACGNDELRATLNEAGEPVAVCLDCGTEYETPPVQDSRCGVGAAARRCYRRTRRGPGSEPSNPPGRLVERRRCRPSHRGNPEWVSPRSVHSARSVLGPWRTSIP
jgi:uncharacterized cupin superfamily protein